MKNWIRSSTIVVLVLAILISISFKAAAGPTPKEDVAAFYKGKTLKFVCSKSPGGGYDAITRLMAPFLAKYTGATVIVKNMPGAGDMLSANYVYNKAKPDGLTIVLVAGPMVALNQVLGVSEVRYDADKFNWLARPNWDIPIFYSSAASPYRSIADLRAAKNFKVGIVGRWSLIGFRGAVTMEALGLSNAKFVAGYPGISQISLALVGGEVDTATASIESVVQSIKSRDSIGLATLSKTRSPLLPDVPTIYEVGMNKEGQKWLEWFLRLQKIQRVVLTGPKVPKDRVDFLRDAIMKTLENKEFLANCAKSGRSMEPMSGEEALRLVQNVVYLNKEELKQLKYIVGKKYYK
ncbi:Bug family tripartite tricarboxylate transporter substrate binding protein [Thermodesulfobacteriota bacterium]